MADIAHVPENEFWDAWDNAWADFEEAWDEAEERARVFESTFTDNEPLSRLVAESLESARWEARTARAIEEGEF